MSKSEEECIWWGVLCLAIEEAETASAHSTSYATKCDQVANKARVALRDIYHRNLDDVFMEAKERFEFLLEQEQER